MQSQKAPAEGQSEGQTPEALTKKQLCPNTTASTFGHQWVKTEAIPVINCTNKIIKASACFAIEKSALRMEILTLLLKNWAVLIFVC